MSDTEVYIGYVLRANSIKQEIYQNVCENNKEHNVRNNDNFCSICGAKVIKKISETITKPLNLWKISLENKKFNDVIYPIECNEELFLINSLNGGKRNFDAFSINSLNDDFFNNLKEEFENNKILQDFISYISETYGEDSFSILEKQIICYWF